MYKIVDVCMCSSNCKQGSVNWKPFKIHQLHAGQGLCLVGCTEGYICVQASAQIRYLSLVSAQGAFQDHLLATLLATCGCCCLLLGAVLLLVVLCMPKWKHTVKLDMFKTATQSQTVPPKF